MIGVSLKTITSISLAELSEMSAKIYGGLVKAVVDVNRKIIVVDADMQSDEEACLLENGSAQNDLWGINLHPESYGTKGFVEFDSMINLRPTQNNRSRSVEDPETQAKIQALITEAVHV